MAEQELAGRTALVTGGSRGIGRAICEILALAGADVAVNYARDEAAAESVRAAVEAAGRRAIIVQADVGDKAAVEAMVARIEGELAPVDLLVCNAGVSGGDALDYVTWQRVMRTNVDGVYLPVMALRDGMLARQYGRIVCIASIAGLRSRPQSVIYGTSKAAVIAFVRNLAPTLAPHVRMNAVAPGLIETDMVAPMDAGRRASMIEGTPMRRIGRPEEIAEMTLFLLSDRSSFTTAQTFVASGGRETLP